MSTTTRVAELVTGHMTGQALPEPASLLIVNGLDGYEVRVQVHTGGLAETAAVLLRWATSLTAVGVRAWRANEVGVHLEVDTTLTDECGAVKLTIYGGVPFNPATFPDVAVGERQAVSLGQLITWAADRPGVAA